MSVVTNGTPTTQDAGEHKDHMLGDVLYAGSSGALSLENEWIALVQSVAAGDQRALHALYERANRSVYAFIVSMTCNRSVSEELTVDTFHAAWRTASTHDAANSTVLGWIMTHARVLAAGWLQREQRRKATGSLMSFKAPFPGNSVQFSERGRKLRIALANLTPEERQAIEAVVFSGSTYAEVAKRMDQPLERIEAWIRSGLLKLEASLQGEDEPVPALDKGACEHAGSLCTYAMQALSPADSPAMEAHVRTCPQCQRALENYRSIIASLVCWPSDEVRLTRSLRERLARRIGVSTEEEQGLPAAGQWLEPEWDEVAPGIWCKLLATDTQSNMVSMLVRLAPGVSYPPHVHAGVEELYLLDGELWIDAKKLYPGDYNHAERGTEDERVWSETGCTCVLITSTRDVLR